jgi:GNAT superfamily N-acetyltransferase
MHNTQNFHIREATPADVGLILTFIKELAEYERMLDQVVATEELLHEWLFKRGIARCLIAEEDGQPIGFALYFFNFSTFVGRGGLYLEDLYIRPAFRGKGYGKRLFRRLAAIAKAEGCGRFEWWCLDWNTPSINFYRSLGAVAMDEWTVYRLDGETLENLAHEDKMP